MATIKTNTIVPVATGYIEVSRQYNNGDGTGRYITYTYRGSKDALRAASADCRRGDRGAGAVPGARPRRKTVTPARPGAKAA